jgi:cbb3-type cytochrome oxidase maturation protein
VENSVWDEGEMSVIVILMLASLAVATLFLAGFIWAVRSGQYDDTCTPSMRILAEDELPRQPQPNQEKAKLT